MRKALALWKLRTSRRVLCARLRRRADAGITGKRAAPERNTGSGRVACDPQERHGKNQEKKKRCGVFVESLSLRNAANNGSG